MRPEPKPEPPGILTEVEARALEPAGGGRRPSHAVIEQEPQHAEHQGGAQPGHDPFGRGRIGCLGARRGPFLRPGLGLHVCYTTSRAAAAPMLAGKASTTASITILVPA